MTLMDLYRLDERTWLVGFSGGKDSSVVLCEVVRALEAVEGEKSKPVYVVFSDTGLEPSPLFSGIHATLARLEEYAREKSLPIVVRHVHPQKGDTLLAKIIGEGMTLPTRQKRWCTDRMKIKPQKAEIEAIRQKHGGYIAITGVRAEESADRAARIAANATTGSSILRPHETPGCASVYPIADWSAADVWRYLHDPDKTLPFIDTAWLGEIYADAAGDGDECASMVAGSAGDTPGCSRSGRFGCVVCPLAYSRDRMLENLSRKYPFFKETAAFRDWLLEYQHGHWEACRDVFNHRYGERLTLNRENHRSGMTSPGGFSLEFRMEVLRRLVELDEKLAQYGQDPLLTDEDLSYVQERWIAEGDFGLSAFHIAGREVDLPERSKVILDAAKVFRIACYIESPGGLKGWRPPRYDTVSAPEFAKDGIYVDDRFVAAVASELAENGESPIEVFANLLFSFSKEKRDGALAKIRALKAYRKGFYPSDVLESAIRSEWRLDSPGLSAIYKERGELPEAERTLFGYDGPGARAHETLDALEEAVGIEDIESLTLHEKMALLDDRSAWLNEEAESFETAA